MNKRIIFKVKKQESKAVRIAWEVCEAVCFILFIITNGLGVFTVAVSGDLGLYKASVVCFLFFILSHELRKEL